ncbi:hypothetical protein [Streptomyces sp. NPDC059552]|uniref:hypothetical protein n=1 Tax=Streptomyces sp. NPDC059552 TaxID=3346862 RepID=UPI0036975E97
MTDAEQEFKETVAQELADLIAGADSVEELRDILREFAEKLGTFEGAAKEHFEGVVERVAKGEDRAVIAEEFKQAILAL